MCMEDVEDLMDYWVDHPPVHVLVAGYMGVKPRSATPADVREIAGMVGGW